MTPSSIKSKYRYPLDFTTSSFVDVCLPKRFSWLAMRPFPFQSGLQKQTTYALIWENPIVQDHKSTLLRLQTISLDGWDINLKTYQCRMKLTDLYPIIFHSVLAPAATAALRISSQNISCRNTVHLKRHYWIASTSATRDGWLGCQLLPFEWMKKEKRQ